MLVSSHNNQATTLSMEQPQLSITIPSQREMNEYLKKIFLQTYDSNAHLDHVRTNYIKLKNKRLASNHLLSYDLPENSIDKSLGLINTSIQKPSNIIKSDYLRLLQQDSKKTTLPTQIQNNKTLCKLYHKLDLFENNLISEQQKQSRLNNNNNQQQQQLTINNYQQYQHMNKQINCQNQRQLQQKQKYQSMLNQAKKQLSIKKDQFYSLKSKFNQQNVLQQFQQSNIINKQHIQLLMYQTQTNLKIKQSKLETLQQKSIQIQSKQLKNILMNQSIQQLTKQLKDLSCELYIKQNAF